MATATKSINYDGKIPDLSQSHAVVCKPNTDVWDKPPSTHRFNAPIIYQTYDVSSFKSARVTVTANWKHKFDQGGLCLILPMADGSRKWIKTGIEFLNDEPHISVVAKDRWSDWSLRPVVGTDSKSATVEIEIHDDKSLWVYLIDGSKKHPMREVAWWGELDPKTECSIGVYAAKPANEQEDLVVNFKDYAVVVA